MNILNRLLMVTLLIACAARETRAHGSHGPVVAKVDKTTVELGELLILTLNTDTHTHLARIVVPGFQPASRQTVTVTATQDEARRDHTFELIPFQPGERTIDTVYYREAQGATGHLWRAGPLKRMSVKGVTVTVRPKNWTHLEDLDLATNGTPLSLAGVRLGARCDDLERSHDMLPWNGYIPGWNPNELPLFDLFLFDDLRWTSRFLFTPSDVLFARFFNGHAVLLGQKTLYEEPVPVERIQRSLGELFPTAKTVKVSMYGNKGVFATRDEDHLKAFVLQGRQTSLVLIAHCPDNTYATAAAITTVIFPNDLPRLQAVQPLAADQLINRRKEFTTPHTP